MLITEFILLTEVALNFSSCSNFSDEKAQASAKRFLKEYLNNLDIYKQILFSKPNNFLAPDTKDTTFVSLFEIIHIYSLINSEKILESLIDYKRILNNKILSKKLEVSLNCLRETPEFLLKVWRHTKGNLCFDNYISRYTLDRINEKSCTLKSVCKRINKSFE